MTNPDVPFTHLAIFETASIQRFIFESGRLRDIRGASALLDDICRHDVRRLVERMPGAKLIRSSGGTTIVGLRDETEFPGLRDAIRRLYASKIPGARLHTAHVACRDEAFPDQLARLIYAAAQEQGRAPETDPWMYGATPMARFCDACGQRPAQLRSQLVDATEFVCQVCACKRDYGQRVRRGKTHHATIQRFFSYAQRQSPSWHGLHIENVLPDGLADVGATSEGSIGLIVADGNRLGQLLQSLTSHEQYERFSRGIAEVVEAAVFETLARFEPRTTKSTDTIIPWEIIYVGGDDVLIAAAADIALDAAVGILRGVEEKSRPLFEELGLSSVRMHLSMAAGIAIAPSSYPILSLHELASQLERSAKKLAYVRRDEDVSTIDFHRLATGGHLDLTTLRDVVWQPWRKAAGETIRLTQRPFTTDQYDAVAAVARAWREKGVPRHKVHALREALFESPAEAMFTWARIVGRAKEKERDAWHQLASLAVADQDSRHLPWIVEDKGEKERRRTSYAMDVVDLWMLQP